MEISGQNATLYPSSSGRGKEVRAVSHWPHRTWSVSGGHQHAVLSSNHRSYSYLACCPNATFHLLSKSQVLHVPMFPLIWNSAWSLFYGRTQRTGSYFEKFPSGFDFLVFLMIRFRWSLWGWSPKWRVCQHVMSRGRISTLPALGTLATWLKEYYQASSLLSYYFSLCNSLAPCGEILGDCADPCYSATLTCSTDPSIGAWVCGWDVVTGQCGLRLSVSLRHCIH